MGNTILIAEDNPIGLDVLCRYFRGGGFTVFPAVSCAEAIRLAGQHHPDCFLLDYHLSDGTAEEVSGFIRNNEYIRKNPIIVLSGDPEQAINSYVLCQADVFVEKGRPYGEILALAKSFLRRAEWFSGTLERGGLTLEAPTLRVLRPSYPPIQLSPEQFRFFSLLLEKSPGFVEDKDICCRVFGLVMPDCRSAIWSLAYRLRQKLGRQLGRRVKSVRHRGWIYVQPRLRADRMRREATVKDPS